MVVPPLLGQFMKLMCLPCVGTSAPSLLLYWKSVMTRNNLFFDLFYYAHLDAGPRATPLKLHNHFMSLYLMYLCWRNTCHWEIPCLRKGEYNWEVGNIRRPQWTCNIISLIFGEVNGEVGGNFGANSKVVQLNKVERSLVCANTLEVYINSQKLRRTKGWLCG